MLTTMNVVYALIVGVSIQGGGTPSPATYVSYDKDPQHCLDSVNHIMQGSSEIVRFTAMCVPMFVPYTPTHKSTEHD